MKKIFIIVLACLGLEAQTGKPIQLNWNDPNPPGDNYNIYRLAGTCPTTPVTTVAEALMTGWSKLVTTAPITVTNYLDSAVVPGQTYCYFVTATLSPVESDPSNLASATSRPFAPTGLVAK